MERSFRRMSLAENSKMVFADKTAASSVSLYSAPALMHPWIHFSWSTGLVACAVTLADAPDALSRKPNLLVPSPACVI